MRRVENPLANRNHVDRFGDRRGVGVVRQRVPRGVDVGGVDDALRRPTDKLVGTLQVVVLVEGLVDVVRIDRLVRRVGALRVERSGAPPAEGRKERVRFVFGRGAGRIEKKRLLGRRTLRARHRPCRCKHNDEPRRTTPSGTAYEAAAKLRKRRKLAEEFGEKRWKRCGHVGSRRRSEEVGSVRDRACARTGQASFILARSCRRKERRRPRL